METPLDVLSRAASLVHADDEKRKLGIYFECFLLCAIIKLGVSRHDFVAICCSFWLFSSEITAWHPYLYFQVPEHVSLLNVIFDC